MTDATAPGASPSPVRLRLSQVRAIFRLATDGLGSRRIVAVLRADPALYPPFGRSGAWTGSYVEQILRSRIAHRQAAARTRIAVDHDVTPEISAAVSSATLPIPLVRVAEPQA